MPDRATILLFEHLAQHHDGPVLLLADENALDAPWARLPPTTQVITNRFDVAEQVKHAGLGASFSDFILTELAESSFAAIGYRVSKEKLVSHHIINACFRLLKPGGQLLLCGEKSDGLKTYARKAANLLGDTAVAKKQGSIYLAKLNKSQEQPGAILDDENYAILRRIANWQDIDLWSKPGVFGWNKIDRGSAYLAEHLADFLSGSAAKSLLDLGCGYGYLAAVASKHGFKRIVATDNNVTALDAAIKTFAANSIHAEAIAADCGGSINETFEINLCNPPFHQGFTDNRRLTERFLAATARLLNPHGKALFVVNGFVPLETLAKPVFGKVSLLAANRSFKLVVLEK